MRNRVIIDYRMKPYKVLLIDVHHRANKNFNTLIRLYRCYRWEWLFLHKIELYKIPMNKHKPII